MAAVKYSIASSMPGNIFKINVRPNQQMFVYGRSGFSLLDLKQRKELKYWENDPFPEPLFSAMFVNSSLVDMVSHGNGLTTHSELRLWKTY
jgi:hypothetical protein